MESMIFEVTEMKRKFRIRIGDDEYIVDVEELTEAENGDEPAVGDETKSASPKKKATTAQNCDEGQ